MKRVAIFLAATLLITVVVPLKSAYSAAKSEAKYTVPSPSLIPSPSPSPITQNQSSYVLFWPIVAGKVAGEPFYFLKTLKEDITEKFIFSDIRKSDHHLFLSKKRLVETEKLLLEKKDYQNAKATAQKMVREFETAITIANSAKGKGKKVQDLYNALSKDGETEAGFLEGLAKQIPEEQRSPFIETVDKMRELVKDIQ